MFRKKLAPLPAAPAASSSSDLSASMVDGPNIITSTRYGPFVVNRHDTHIGRSMQTYGEYSPAELACFSQWVRPGGVAIEAGANIGAFSVGLSRLLTPSGTLFVFEPQRQVFQLLCANLALSQCTNVHAFRYGLASTTSVMNLPAIDYASSGNFGGVALSSAGSEQVPVYPLDRWEISGCQFIKIDVEGMELEVLRGAEATIRRCRPVLYVEDDREGAHPSLVALLVDFGYDMYWHVPPLFSTNNFKGVSGNVLPSTHSLNLLCLPKELNVPREVARDINTYGGRWDGWKYLPGDYL
jgi:FkbM family methyltransferase